MNHFFSVVWIANMIENFWIPKLNGWTELPPRKYILFVSCFAAFKETETWFRCQRKFIYTYTLRTPCASVLYQNRKCKQSKKKKLRRVYTLYLPNDSLIWCMRVVRMPRDVCDERDECNHYESNFSFAPLPVNVWVCVWGKSKEIV